MINEEFCNILEFKLSKAILNSTKEDIKGFWCDGVSMSKPENFYSRKYINDNRKTILTSYLGKGGQTDYLMTLIFGAKALSRYARNLDIIECIPSEVSDEWFKNDEQNKSIEVNLV